jgi:uncharacterized protein
MKFGKRSLWVTIILLSLGGRSLGQMVILSGPEKGSYNSFANDIVKVLGEKNGISLLNRTTGGSAYNFKRLTDPQTAEKMALIQSDYLNLMEGEDKLNNTKKTASIKVVLKLATEEIHIIAKKNSGLNKLQDLNNKKVAIGNEDQGSFATGKIIKERSKINWSNYYVGYDQLLKQLSAGSVDACLLVGSAPVNLLDIDPQVMIIGMKLLELDDFSGWAQYYENDTIYRSDYKWLDKDIPTFGVRTLLIVNESKLTDDEKKIIPAIKAGIIQNLDLLKKQGHPKWKDVIIPDEAGFVPVKTEVTTGAKQPEAVGNNDKVIFRVQIFSSNLQQKKDQVIINGEGYKTYMYSYLGAYRYTIGEFTSLSSAVELQNICRKNSYPEAFVAAFKNNVRNLDPSLFK